MLSLDHRIGKTGQYISRVLLSEMLGRYLIIKREVIWCDDILVGKLSWLVVIKQFHRIQGIGLAENRKCDSENDDEEEEVLPPDEEEQVPAPDEDEEGTDVMAPVD